MHIIFTILALYGPPVTTHDWALVAVEGTTHRYWQALSQSSVFSVSDAEARRDEIRARVAAVDRTAANGEGCPAGMVRVTGKMPDSTEVIAAQNQACEDVDWNPRFLCTKFDETKLLPAPSPRKTMDYCVDRFEFPNIPGEYPGTLLSYTDGVEICASESKHLCTDDEWTFACEGPQALPYPYGYARYVDPRSHFPDHIIAGDGCNIDVIRHGIHFNPKKMLRHKWERGGVEEIDKLWAGTRAGERQACVSPFGVYDITGNIEEWVRQPKPKAHTSVLKGGYWSPVESRCQPSNAAHGPGHAYYQTGFRCCGSVVAAGAAEPAGN